jgi:hypothetical protein
MPLTADDARQLRDSFDVDQHIVATLRSERREIDGEIARAALLGEGSLFRWAQSTDPGWSLPMRDAVKATLIADGYTVRDDGEGRWWIIWGERRELEFSAVFQAHANLQGIKEECSKKVQEAKQECMSKVKEVWSKVWWVDEEQDDEPL